MANISLRYSSGALRWAIGKDSRHERNANGGIHRRRLGAGIGRATALALARNGWEIAITDIDGDAVAEAAAWVAREPGLAAQGFLCDSTSETDVAALVEQLAHVLPPVEGLVNNAGLSSPTRFVDMSMDEWERMFAVNVTGIFLMTKALVPGMLSRGFGRIVMISSAAAQRGGGYFGGVHYSVSKAALPGLAGSLARELGPAGVTVNAFAAGAIDTSITAGLLTAEHRESISTSIPVGRFGSPREIAAAVAYPLLR